MYVFIQVLKQTENTSTISTVLIDFQVFIPYLEHWMGKKIL